MSSIFGSRSATPSLPRQLTRTLIGAAALAALASLASIARADAINGHWNEIAQPAGAPISNMYPRAAGSIVYDSFRDRLIQFGGDQGPSNQVFVLNLSPGSNWTRMFPLGTPPFPRYGQMAIYDPVNDRMIVFGGYAPDSYEGQVNDVWQLSLSGAPTWSQIFPAGTPPSPRQDGAAIYDPVGQRLVVFGGASSVYGFQNDVWQLNLTYFSTWTQLTPSGLPPSARDLSQYAYDPDHGSLVLFGGWDGASFLGDAWELTLAGAGSWAPVSAGGAPSPRREGVSCYDPSSQSLVFFGGLNSGGFLDETWQLLLSGSPAWTHLTPGGVLPSARSDGRGCYDPVRKRLILFGGYDGGYDRDTRALSLTGSLEWKNLFAEDAGQIMFRRDNVTVIRPDTRDMFTFGGLSPSGNDNNETWKLSLATPNQVWTQESPGGLIPTPRHGHRAVWDPVRQRMIMVGGYDFNYENDVWAYSPSPSPTWTQLSIAGTPPQGRMLFGLAYDPVRDQLILVGGHSGFPPNSTHPYWNDVWSIPLSGPNANTWVPLSPSGTPPAPRWIYGMQYDAPRDRMVFFGGVTDAGRPNDAWALNLGGSTSWTQILPLGGPPPGRSDHGMVYDPYVDRMVVFGGYDGVFDNDVWALNFFGTPSWMQLHPDGGPPIGRDIFMAAFDLAGNQMVFMGGFDGDNLMRDTWALTWLPPIVAAQASLVSSSATPEGVRIEWMVPNASTMQFRAERGSNGGWSPVADPTLSGTDRVVLDDPDVPVGAHLTYRLWLRSSSGENLASEVTVDVPQGYRFALEGAHPNPAAGDRLMIAYSLPRAESARLDVLDLAGRRVASQDLSGAGAGRHVIAVAPLHALDPGVYLVKLSAGEGTRTAKVSVMK